jgi:hypothetical protein
MVKRPCLLEHLAGRRAELGKTQQRRIGVRVAILKLPPG